VREVQVASVKVSEFKVLGGREDEGGMGHAQVAHKGVAHHRDLAHAVRLEFRAENLKRVY